MADIQISIPNDQVNRVVDAFCSVGDYPGDPEDQQSRREFARMMIRSYVRDTVLQYERQEKTRTALSGVTVEPVQVD